MTHVVIVQSGIRISCSDICPNGGYGGTFVPPAIYHTLFLILLWILRESLFVTNQAIGKRSIVSVRYGDLLLCSQSHRIRQFDCKYRAFFWQLQIGNYFRLQRYSFFSFYPNVFFCLFYLILNDNSSSLKRFKIPAPIESCHSPLINSLSIGGRVKNR